MRMPRQSSGTRSGRTRFVRCRKPLSQYSSRRQAVFALTSRRARSPYSPSRARNATPRSVTTNGSSRSCSSGGARKTHGRHVAERQLAPLDHRDQLAGRAAELDDAADQLEVNAIAEALAEELAESRRGAIVDGGGLLVATEFDDQFRRRVVGHERLCYITKRDG